MPSCFLSFDILEYFRDSKNGGRLLWDCFIQQNGWRKTLYRFQHKVLWFWGTIFGNTAKGNSFGIIGFIFCALWGQKKIPLVKFGEFFQKTLFRKSNEADQAVICTLASLMRRPLMKCFMFSLAILCCGMTCRAVLLGVALCKEMSNWARVTAYRGRWMVQKWQPHRSL